MAWPRNNSRWPWAILAAAGALAAMTLWRCHTIDASSPSAFSRPLLPPGSGHWLGTNSTGEDILAELLLGAPVTLMTALAAAALAIGLGSLAGGVSGYFRGRLDTLIMRLCDIFLVLPGLPFMIVLAALMRPGAASIVIAVGATSWPPTARVVRAQVLQLREQGFVRAAQGLGAGHAAIVLRHLLPNAGPIILARASLTMASAMLAETGLSFLGLGDPVRKSWGAMLHDAFSGGALTSGAWWWYGPPMLGIVIFVLLFVDLAHRWNRPLPLRFSMRAKRHACADPTCDQGEISAHHFSVRFANPHWTSQTVVNGLRCVIQRGEKVALCGVTASGKSLVLQGLLGLLPQSAQVTGALCLRQQNLACLSEKALRRLRRDAVAYVPQATSLAFNPVRRLGPQIIEKSRLQGHSGPALYREAMQLLEEMGFAQPMRIMRHYPHHLSGGMRQRAAFAMALMGDYQILLADEPTKNLDMQSRQACLDILNRIQDKTVLIVTHDLDLARRCARRILHIGGGLLLEDALVDNFFDNPLHPSSRLMVSSMPENGFVASSPLRIPQPVTDGASQCPFASHCPHAMAVCRKMPEMFTSGETRVRCWLYADRG